jgi:TRAP-type C4-dicarboxylate transport system permease small subunit
MKKAITLSIVLLTSLTSVSPAFAQTTTGGVTQIQTFIQSIIQVMITLAGLVAVGFFVWGGFGYITSSGNPESLDRSKKTILYSAIGLAIVLGAFVLTSVVTQLATQAFGAGQ